MNKMRPARPVHSAKEMAILAEKTRALANKSPKKTAAIITAWLKSAPSLKKSAA